MKIVVLSDIPPTKELTAGRMLRAFIESIDAPIEIDSIIIGDPEFLPLYRADCLGRVFFAKRPLTNWTWLSNSRREQWLIRGAWRRDCARILSRVEALLERLNPDLILTAPQCPVLVEILRNLTFRSAPIVGFMWDHPAWWAEAHGLGESAAEDFSQAWFSVMNSMSALCLPSEGARALFPASSSAPTVVLHPWTPAANLAVSQARELIEHRNELHIAFTGQTYAIEEFLEFVERLRFSGWRHGDRHIHLHLYGRAFPQFEVDDRVFTYNWLSADELVNEISNYDLAFLPYFREGNRDEVSATSFPSKLAVYTSAGLPILYLGNPKSHVAQFIESNKVGTVVTSGSEWDMSETLEKALAVNSSQTALVFARFFGHDALRAAVTSVMSLIGFKQSRLGHQPQENDHGLRAPSIPVSTGVWRHGGLGVSPSSLSEIQGMQTNIVRWNNLVSSEHWYRLVSLPGVLSSGAKRVLFRALMLGQSLYFSSLRGLVVGSSLILRRLTLRPEIDEVAIWRRGRF